MTVASVFSSVRGRHPFLADRQLVSFLADPVSLEHTTLLSPIYSPNMLLILLLFKISFLENLNLMSSRHKYSDTFPVMFLFHINELAFLVYIQFWGELPGSLKGRSKMTPRSRPWDKAETWELVLLGDGRAGCRKPRCKLVGIADLVSSVFRHYQKLTFSCKEAPWAETWQQRARMEKRSQLRVPSDEARGCAGKFSSELSQRAVLLNHWRAVRVFW